MNQAINHPTEAVIFHLKEHGELTVIDQTARRRCRMWIDGSTAVEAGRPSQFLFPVDRSIEFETTSLEIEEPGSVFIRDPSGQVLSELTVGSSTSFAEGLHVMEISGQIKSYLTFSGPFTVEYDPNRVSVSFPSAHSVHLGSRSSFQHPIGRVTSTSDPHDLIAAISTFGTALKTMSPERSFPSLRGHPPLLEIANDNDIPRDFEPPCPSVSVVVPPTYHDIFEAAPLVFYLGANLESDSYAGIRIDGEDIIRFDTGDADSADVETALKHVFTLDCIVRTVGIYPVELEERAAIEDRLDLDLEDLYHDSPPNRLRRYLTTPISPVLDVAPTWPQIAHLADDPTSARFLPPLLNRLASIRVHSAGISNSSPIEDTDDPQSLAVASVIDPPIDPGDSLVQAHTWVGPGYVRGCTKALFQGYLHRYTREVSSDRITFSVVCNDDRFHGELNAVEEAYQSNVHVPLDVVVNEGLSRDALASELENTHDFLHFIGHVRDDGFVCEDGILRPDDLESVGSSVLMVNACNSYRLGTALVEAGAVASIVTLGDVIDESAAWMGVNLGRLLFIGFPLETALNILRTESLIGQDYLAIGDGRVAVSQPRTNPNLLTIEYDDQHFEVIVNNIMSDQVGTGSLMTPFIPGIDSYTLVPKAIDLPLANRQQLRDYLSLEEVPVQVNGGLRWSSDLLNSAWLTAED